MSSSKQSRPKAFDLPEIASELAHYLTGRELTNCIRVNKAWFTSFVPHIWKTVRVDDIGFSSESQHASKSLQSGSIAESFDWNVALRRYGDLIRSLSVSVPRTLHELGPSLTDLRSLDLNYFMDSYLNSYHSPGRWHTYCQGSMAILCSIFLQNTTTLTTIRITVTLQDNMITLTNALRQVSTLEELVIFDMALPGTRCHYLDALLEGCKPTTNLKRLVCCQGAMPGDYMNEPALVATHGAQELGTVIRPKIVEKGSESIKGVQELRWSIPCFLEVNDREEVVRTLRSCGSALQRLYFAPFADDKVGYLLDVIRESCTNLRQLGFTTSNDVQDNKGIWIALLEICPPLEVLIVKNTIPATQLVDVLERRHTGALVRVYLDTNTKSSAARSDLLRILEFCPHLEEFVCRRPVSSSSLRYSSTFTASLLGSVPEKTTATTPSTRWACNATLRRLTLSVATPFSAEQDRNALQREVAAHIFHNATKLSQLTLVPTMFPTARIEGGLIRIEWDESNLREVHQAMRYSTKMTCPITYGGEFVANFE
ncbi:hypothetical protein BGZ47_005497 [Haplosporangium gracile]|nr:hypothetical protein BGZ47_005497 [Haplosporangium gracile]